MQNTKKEENFDVKLYQTFYKNNVIQPLKGFCSVIENNYSITKASQKLHLTTSAINKQISSLEQKLGIKLFQKTIDRSNGNYIELTKDGIEFYNKVKVYVKKLDNILSEYLEDKQKNKLNVLKIGTTTALMSKFVPYVYDFQENNSNIKVAFDVYSQDEAMELLKNNELDIFISTIEDNEKLDNELYFEKIKRYTPYWILYKGHKLENKKSEEISKIDILDCDLVFNENGLTSRDLRNFIKTNNLKSIINNNDFSLEDIKQLVKNKVGIFLIFDIFLNKKDYNDFIFKDASNIFYGGYLGCYYKKILQQSIIDNFINFLKKEEKHIFNNK